MSICQECDEFRIDSKFDSISLEIYSDEIFRVKDRDGAVWMYLGAIFVPTTEKESCLKKLNNYRCLKCRDWSLSEEKCSHRCRFHNKNNTEIHYKELHKLDTRYKIAKNWITFVNDTACKKGNKQIYFNIIGLNLTNMDLSQFGADTDRDLTIYNRFYRTLILSGINYFFKPYKKISIVNIYHDKGGQESHTFFPWHPIWKIDHMNNKIEFIHREIEFLDSDHRKSLRQESQFIQLIDIILGATYTCLHDLSSHIEKKRVGVLFKPTLEALLSRRKLSKVNGDPYMGGKYYSSDFYRTYQITFFPKTKINPEDITACLNLLGEKKDTRTERDQFYYDRSIVLKDPDQSNLSKWF